MSSKLPQQVAVTIRIESSNASIFDEVVRKLLRVGLSDVEAHPRFGIVNGSAMSSVVALLRDIPGVASVREDRKYGVAHDA